VTQVGNRLHGAGHLEDLGSRRRHGGGGGEVVQSALQRGRVLRRRRQHEADGVGVGPDLAAREDVGVVRDGLAPLLRDVADGRPQVDELAADVGVEAEHGGLRIVLSAVGVDTHDVGQDVRGQDGGGQACVLLVIEVGLDRVDLRRELSTDDRRRLHDVLAGAHDVAVGVVVSPAHGPGEDAVDVAVLGHLLDRRPDGRGVEGVEGGNEPLRVERDVQLDVGVRVVSGGSLVGSTEGVTADGEEGDHAQAEAHGQGVIVLHGVFSLSSAGIAPAGIGYPM
jgi:hypothetical protein